MDAVREEKKKLPVPLSFFLFAVSIPVKEPVGKEWWGRPPFSRDQLAFFVPPFLFLFGGVKTKEGIVRKRKKHFKNENS